MPGAAEAAAIRLEATGADPTTSDTARCACCGSWDLMREAADEQVEK